MSQTLALLSAFTMTLPAPVLDVPERAWSAGCADRSVRIVEARFAGADYLAVADMQACVVYLSHKWRRWPRRKLCTILVHEYGHLAGLGHSTNPRSVMYPYPPTPDWRCAGTTNP